MSIEQITAEELARLFHQYQRTLAPIFDCANAPIDADWDEAGTQERKLMIATARLVLSDLVDPKKHRELANPAEGRVDRSYFAKPGEAEWGC